MTKKRAHLQLWETCCVGWCGLTSWLGLFLGGADNDVEMAMMDVTIERVLDSSMRPESI